MCNRVGSAKLKYCILAHRCSELVLARTVVGVNLQLLGGQADSGVGWYEPLDVNVIYCCINNN